MNITGARLGARSGAFLGIQKLVARAMSRDLQAFVVPGPDLARARGLNIEAAGLRLAATPRHAGVLLVIGPLSQKMRDAAAIVYAQMPRPRVILALGSGELAPLPPADVSAELTPSGLDQGISALRQIIASGAFAKGSSDFTAPVLETRIEYTCPMHPEIVRDEPGNCPKCGMTLMPRETGSDATQAQHAGHSMGVMAMATTVQEKHEQPRNDKEAHKMADAPSAQYTCPMHPEVQSDAPGSCPKCGMHLVPVEDGKTDSHAGHSHHGDGHKMAAAPAAQYTCPMHPEVQSDAPGSCPKCGMHLVPVEDSKADSHSGHAGQGGHSGHGGGASVDGIEPQFMSMVDLTKDQPRSSDGLQMDWIPVAFGPFFPGLPGGLDLELMLDGDTVAGAKTGSLVALQPTLVTTPQTAAEFITRLARSMPLTPVTYQLLAILAIEDAAGVQPDDTTARRRAAALERERIASHLNWLSALGAQAGFGWLASRAAQFQLQIQDSDADQIAAIAPALASFLRRLHSTPLLRARLKNIARTDPDAAVTGPVSRARKSGTDLRSTDATYTALGFEAASEKGGDAFARFLVRCDEIKRSLQLIAAAGSIATPALAEIGAASGQGASTLETPRGAARLSVQLEKGQVVAASLETPSMLHASLIEELTAQQELGDALVAVASLDLSPWEMQGAGAS